MNADCQFNIPTSTVLLRPHVAVSVAVLGLHDCPEFWSVVIEPFTDAHQGAAE